MKTAPCQPTTKPATEAFLPIGADVIPTPPRRWQWLMCAILLIATASDTALGQSALPAITSIRVEGTNVVVTARVPAGPRRLTLEGREGVATGTWQPRAAVSVDGSGGIVTFRVPCLGPIGMVRG